MKTTLSILLKCLGAQISNVCLYGLFPHAKMQFLNTLLVSENSLNSDIIQLNSNTIYPEIVSDSTG